MPWLKYVLYILQCWTYSNKNAKYINLFMTRNSVFYFNLILTGVFIFGTLISFGVFKIFADPGLVKKGQRSWPN